MDRINVLIYLNSTGDEALDKQAMAAMELMCKGYNYNIVHGVIDFTDDGTMSQPIRNMILGYAVTGEIEGVLTIAREMIGDDDKALDFTSMMDDYGVVVETAADDMDCIYYRMLTRECEDLHDEDSDDCEDTEEMIADVVHAVKALYAGDQMITKGYTIKVVSYGVLLINNKTQEIRSFATEEEALDFLKELKEEKKDDN